MGKVLSSGVSIITSTYRPHYINNVFRNYARQKWQPKELIIVLNKDTMRLSDYQNTARQYPGVRVFRRSERSSLGECLNFAAGKSKYSYIAKFDDDDYYAPDYIPEAMYMFKHANADLVGKKSFYFYFPHKKILLLHRKSTHPFRRCYRIAGATIMFHKKVLRNVRFVKVRSGTDARFISACLRKGYKMYSTSRYNFTAVRRANSQSHTWKISDDTLLSKKNTQITRTKLYKTFVSRSLHQLRKTRTFYT